MATISLNNSNFHHNWRCCRCGQLLGVTDGERLEIRYRRRFHYLVPLPASCVCPDPRCNTVNELSDAAAAAQL